MAYEITYDDIIDGFSTSASQYDVNAYIAIVDMADACMTANAVPDAIGQRLKITAVRHMAQEADGGQVTQQRAVSGASRTFVERGAGSTNYLTLLKQIDRWGCVTALVTNGSSVWIGAVGRYDE